MSFVGSVESLMFPLNEARIAPVVINYDLKKNV